MNTHDRSVTLICDPDFSRSLIGTNLNLPTYLQDFLGNRRSRLSFASLPMAPRLRPLAEDILNPPYSGELRDMMLESKALELLCLTVEQTLNGSGSKPALRQRDVNRVRELCAILESDPASTASIGSFCRMLAWNESQMIECFKAVTGSTISSYRHRLRMEQARRQLRETEASVTQIALDAGYDHPGNFATAYKRTFGYPPSKDRSP